VSAHQSTLAEDLVEQGSMLLARVAEAALR
jgi:hypothetical protein